MPHTETFIVSSNDKKVKKADHPSKEYFGQGKQVGTADMVISVFGYNHKETAEQVYNALKQSGMENDFFHIKVESKSHATGKVLRIGDTVTWRGTWGTDEPQDVKVTDIEINCKGKNGDRVTSVNWEQVKDRSVIVDLDNNRWAYGYQIKPKS